MTAHGPEAVRTWRGTMPVQFRYTPGAAGLRFFQTLKRKGLFAATRCEACRRTYLPPRLYCEECFADLSTAWVDVHPRGSVHSFTLVYVDREGRRLKEPEIAAFVRIDGTDGGLVARLVNVAPADLRLEMPVEAVLLPPRRRRASLDDIIGFGPVGPTTPRPARRRRKATG